MDRILTLIVPSYNMEAYLPRCLDSVLSAVRPSTCDLQPNIEIIVVNDGSKDKTSEIAHGYETRYPGVVRVIDKANGHYGSCINAALKVAQGRFVKVLEPDDGYNTDDFWKFVEELSRGEESGALSDVDLIVTDYAFTDTDGKPTDIRKFDYPVRKRMAFDEFQQPLKYHIMLPAVTYRTSIFKQFDYHQTEGCPYTDLEWLTYPMRMVRHAYYLPYSIYRYFIGREGQSVNPETFKRGIGTIVRLLKRMLGDYATLVDPARPAVEAYVQKVLLAQLHVVYESYLLERNRYLTREQVLELDEAVRAVPSLYAKTGEFALHSRRFDFKYVAEFRRARSRDSLKFWLLRLYSALAKLVRS